MATVAAAPRPLFSSVFLRPTAVTRRASPAVGEQLSARETTRAPADTFETAAEPAAALPLSRSRAEGRATAAARAQALRGQIERGELARSGDAASLPGSAVRFDDDADGHFVGSDGRVTSGDAALGAVEAFEPRGGAREADTIVEVNGVNNSVAKQVRELQGAADTWGTRVVGLHNGKEGGNFVSSWYGGIQQVLEDKAARTPAELLRNPATASLARLLLSELAQGRPMHLAGHSHGALIVSNALKVARLIIDGKYAPDAYPPALRKKMGAAFDASKVETFGGAAADFPKGPSYVHYFNKLDVVSKPVGLMSESPATLAERAGGDKATVVFFKHALIHHFPGAYVSQRLPFDEVKARAAGAPTLTL